MNDSDTIKKLVERKKQIKRHLSELKRSLQLDLTFAFEYFYESRAHTYFSYEEKIHDFEVLFLTIEDQVDDASTLSDLTRTAERLAYVEDRLDELQSQIYNRPRRRRRKPFSFGDFFNRFTQNGGGSEAQGEVSSLAEAYHILGLEEGAGLAGVTAAFRRFAKEYHPDTRGGDRSSEKELRKVMDAYQLIKEHLAESNGF